MQAWIQPLVNHNNFNRPHLWCNGQGSWLQIRGPESVSRHYQTRTMKNAVFWDVMPCGSCKNRRFGGTYYLLHQGEKCFFAVFNLLVAANVVSSSAILVALMMEAKASSQTSVLNKSHAE
jgi:hypothetical protein